MISQYYKVTLTTKNDVIDITKDINDGLSLEDEDGTIKTLRFKMVEGMTNLDKLYRGASIDLVGGDIVFNSHLFAGKITELLPKFLETGEVTLDVVCQGGEGTKLARISKDVIYPSDNHNKPWGKRSTTYSELIMNLGRDAGLVVENRNISVKKDINLTRQNPVRQHKQNDWLFMQSLAKKINCTIWVVSKGGNDYLHLMDDSIIINRLGNKTFFFLSRTQGSNFVDIPYGDPKRIKMESVEITLESAKTEIKQSTNPKTGKSEVVANVTKSGDPKHESESGEVERWVLDESKVKGLSGDARRDLINSFIDGKIEWESNDGGVSAKTYFKLATNEESSRVGKNNNIEVEVSDDHPEVSANGVTTMNGKKENTGSRTYKTVIDQDLVRKMSSEERSALMGRIARGEITSSDKKYYTVVDTTPKPDKEGDTKHKDDTSSNTQEPKKTNVAKSKSSTTNVGKRDSGFKIEAKVFGRLDIAPRSGYVLEGLGKYSGSYYLYRVIHSWGDNGWNTMLTFTK